MLRSLPRFEILQKIFKQADRDQLGASKKKKKEKRKKQSSIRPHVTISNQFNLAQNWFMIMLSSEKGKQTDKLKVSLTIREIVNVLLSFPKMFLLTPTRRTNKTFYKLKHHT